MPVTNAFDILMNRKNKNLQADQISPSLLIPKHCTPAPMISQLGQELTASRHLARSLPSISDLDLLEGSPQLKKRGAGSLDSPNSPTENNCKKNKVIANPP